MAATSKLLSGPAVAGERVGEMKLQPGDKEKLMVVVPAIVLALLFMIFRLKPATPADHGAGAAASTHAKVATAADTATVNSVATAASVSTHDPFWCDFGIRAYDRNTGSGTRSVAPTPVGPASVGPGQIVPGTIAGKFGVAARPVLADIELQGILTDEGTNSVAVVKVGESVRYLREGSQIDFATLLQRILPGHIQLLQHGQALMLPLGQTLVRAAPAVKTGKEVEAPATNAPVEQHEQPATIATSALSAAGL